MHGVQHKTIVGFDDDGNEYIKNNQVTQSIETDSFDRVSKIHLTKQANGHDFLTEYEYVEGTDADNKYTLDLVSNYKQSLNGTELSDYSYTYDANGNITGVYRDDVLITKYWYNDLNELISYAERDSGKYTFFTYDDDGNIIKKSESVLGDDGWYPKEQLSKYNYTYDNIWKDKLVSYDDNGTVYNITYDDMGNPLTYRDGMTMVWQNGRELKSVTTDEYTVNYTYNADGYRTQKTVIDSDGNEDTTYYYYDDNNKLIGLTNGVNDFVFFYDTNGEISSMWMNNTVYYFFVKNAQGDVVSVITSGGRVQVQYTYDAWGNPISITNSIGTDASSSFYATVLSFMYRGYYYDAETGFYYLNSRYYDPVTGRFINADTYMDTDSGTPLSTNMYAYCENNPVMFTDPNGEWAIKDHEKLCRDAGFSSIIQTTSTYADKYFASDDAYSAPFHSRPEGLKIAVYLYNKALKLERSCKIVDFSYDSNKKGTLGYLNPVYLGYINRSNKRTYAKTHPKALKLLDILNNTYGYTIKRVTYQSAVLYGLALHVLQDYFAHTTKILYGTDVRRISNGVGKWTSATSFSNNVIENIGAFEDNKDVLEWRYKNSQKITIGIKRSIDQRRTISSIYENSDGYIRKTVAYKLKNKIENKRIKYYFSYTEYKLVIKYL